MGEIMDLIGFLLIVVAIGMVIGIVIGYRRGQIDALSGKVRYRKSQREVWVKTQEKDNE